MCYGRIIAYFGIIVHRFFVLNIILSITSSNIKTNKKEKNKNETYKFNRIYIYIYKSGNKVRSVQVSSMRSPIVDVSMPLNGYEKTKMEHPARKAMVGWDR